ncbi:MAG: FtsX-like permease family protein, partial [Promethearchaeota archaeon]
GAYKTYNLSIVLLQGLLLCGIGSVISIILAFFLTQFIFIPLISSILAGGLSLTFNISFSTQIISFIIPFIIGILVGLAVSLSPAIKVMRLQLIESIHPYRHEDTLYHLRKRSSVNYKLILIGLIIAINGGFIYFIIPRILISNDLNLFAGTLIAILLIFLIGLTLAGLGLIPLFLRLIIEIFRPFGKNLYHVIKIFVFRYQRRNSSTVIMCALSFSFVIFTTTVISDFTIQREISTTLDYGSDLVLETIGWREDDLDGFGFFGGGFDDFFDFDFGDDAGSDEPLDPNKIFTIEFQQEILKIEGVERVSSVVSSPEHLSQLSFESGEEYSASIGDYAGINTNSISLIGVDESYYSTVNNEYITFTYGDKESAFEKIHDDEYTCIISEAIGVDLNIGLNEKIRIHISRGDESKNYVFTVIGRASTIPGFSDQFSSSASEARRGGVIVSQQTYIDLLGISPLPSCDKLFIKIQDNGDLSSTNIEDAIKDLYRNEYNFKVLNLDERTASQRRLFRTMEQLFSLILITTIVISLFGLLASSYSTIIERKKEIGIVRTLGLKGRDISKLFIIEALIIMFSSGTLGILLGYFTGWLLTSNMSLLGDLPSTTTFPLSDAFTIYILSTLFIIIGMIVLLRKIRKKKIVDIYRETM